MFKLMYVVFVMTIAGAGDAAAAGGDTLMLWKRRFLDAMRYRQAALHDKKVLLCIDTVMLKNTSISEGTFYL